MTNYTPIDLSLFVREGDSRVRIGAKGKDGFDRIFFPFSILVLILSLSFYAIRLVIDISSPLVKPQTPEPTKAPSAVIRELAGPTSTPSPADEVYRQINTIRIDTDLMLKTAEAQYPSLSGTQLVDLVNKSLVEWAALREYYEDDGFVTQKLTLQVEEPVATFGAVLRDLGVLASQYDKDKKSGQTPVSAVVDNFTNRSSIR